LPYQRVSTTPHPADVLNRYSESGIIGQKIQLQALELQFVEYLSAFGSLLSFLHIYLHECFYISALPCGFHVVRAIDYASNGLGYAAQKWKALLPPRRQKRRYPPSLGNLVPPQQ
jgi:hypothetical protein